MLIEIIEIVKRRRAPALSHPVVIPRDVKSTGENVCRFAVWPSAANKGGTSRADRRISADERKRGEARILSRDNNSPRRERRLYPRRIERVMGNFVSFELTVKMV